MASNCQILSQLDLISSGDLIGKGDHSGVVALSSWRSWEKRLAKLKESSSAELGKTSGEATSQPFAQLRGASSEVNFLRS